MTDSVLLPGPGRLVVAGQTRAAAFRRAARHSRHVRRLRGLILAGAVLLAGGIVVFTLFDPFAAIVPSGVSVEGAGLSGSKITMAHPKMSGYRKDGRPYTFTAETAVQDLKTPGILQLSTLDAQVTMTDGVAHVKAETGVYDTATETMDLRGDIRITSAAGYDIRMRSAHIEFKGNIVISKEPVQVKLTSGSVDADSMRMAGTGSDVSFEGHVRSVLRPGGENQSDALLKGRAP